MGLLRLGEFGEDGEGEGLRGGAFALGEVAGAVAEIAVAFLEVERERVVDLGADSRRGEMCAECVAVRGADDELVVDVVIFHAGAGPRLDGELQGAVEAELCECFPIIGGACAACGAPFVEVREFYGEDGALDRINAEVAADPFVKVARLHAVVAQGADLRGEGVVGAGDHAGVAECAEVLGRVEGEPSGFANRARAAERMLRAECLRGVFEDGHAVLFSQRDDGRHVRATAVEVDGDDGLDVRSVLERGFKLRGRDVVSGGIDIHEDGSRADARDAARSGEKSVRRGEHGVARPDVEGHEEDELRIGAGGDADAVPRAAVRRDGIFKRLRLRPEHEGLAVAHGFDLGHDAGLERGILRAEIEERDLHGGRK